MNTKRILALVLCALICFTSVYADSLNVSYDPETELINIEGSFDDVSKSSMYSIEVKKVLDDSVVYTSIENVNSKNFKTKVMLSSDCEPEEYYVSVMPYSGAGANSKDKPIFVSSSTKKDDILKNVLSNQTDKEVMVSSWDEIYEFIKENVLKILLDIKSKIPTHPKQNAILTESK